MLPTRYRLIVLLLSACCLFPPTHAMPQLFPKQKLRGYGTVSANNEQLSGGASRLTITCENEACAQLTLAKYLSDQSLLPPIAPSRFAAGRVGAKVFLCADPAGRAASLLPAGAVTKAETTVPMWLDRWDRFGFRFYYRPWETPPDRTMPPYDIRTEFDFARKSGAGMIFWADQNQVDTAEGMMQDAWWEWAQNEAKAAGIGVGINLQAVPTTWLVNRYRADTTSKMPQYIGGFYKVGDPWLGGMGWFSWASRTGENAQENLMSGEVKRRTAESNVITFLEPHGELKHGNHDLFLEYGPAADAGYRAFLKRRYRALATLNARWGENYTDWKQVRVPEMASFAGWGPDAIDLTGEWRIGYEPFADGRDRPNWELSNQFTAKTATVPAPAQWFETAFDDSAWPTVTAPGDDRAMLWPKRPAVLRRRVALPKTTRKLYLYIWDLNLGFHDVIKAAVNGKVVGESAVQWDTPHWCAFDVTDAVSPGDNQFAIRVPKGFFGYRVYLSPHPPRQYPNLGAHGNARWVDFCDGQEDARLETLKRGAEMIRRVDPNRQIVLMSPDSYARGDKALSEDYGGELHDTGYMSGFWADFDPMLARSGGKPFSLEPGSPPGNLAELKKMTGLWLSEGTNGVDYFQHIGDLFWKPDLRAYFDSNKALYRLLGKYHAPKASVAVLFSDRVQRLTGYPWQPEPNALMRNGFWDNQGGYWRFNVAANLLRSVDRDGVTEADFARGNAAQYRLIFDSGNSVMDDRLVGELEKYVRRGGVFVTFGQTGRHTSTDPDSWPICRLTGTRVVRIDPHDRAGNALVSRRLAAAVEGQHIFGSEWNGVAANGLGLEKVAPECRDLLRWDDGRSAAVIRPLGKGFVIHLGVKFSGDRIPDRIMGASETDADRSLTRLLLALCDWRKVARIPARVEAGPNQHVLLRHYISNNGLWDVWTLWNESDTEPAKARLVWKTAPACCKEVKGGALRGLNGSTLEGIELPPWETRVFLTPRAEAGAPTEWLTLQRSWWKASAEPRPNPLPESAPKWSLPLEDGWRMASKSVRLGVVRNNAAHRVVFTRQFTVPTTWREGRTELWVLSFWQETFVGQGRVLLDGLPLSEPSARGIAGRDVTDRLVPGTSHTLAVEVTSTATLIGARGTCWLWHRPKPGSSIDLAGEWETTRDGVHPAQSRTLPGDWSGMTASRTVRLPASLSGQTVMLVAEGNAGIVGAIVNGHYVRRHHHRFGDRLDLNITPWLRAGADNRIEIVTWDGATEGVVRAVRLDFFDSAIYP